MTGSRETGPSRVKPGTVNGVPEWQLVLRDKELAQRPESKANAANSNQAGLRGSTNKPESARSAADKEDTNPAQAIPEAEAARPNQTRLCVKGNGPIMARSKANERRSKRARLRNSRPEPTPAKSSTVGNTSGL